MSKCLRNDLDSVVTKKSFLLTIFKCFLEDLKIDMTNRLLRPYQTINCYGYLVKTDTLTLAVMIINFLTNTNGLALCLHSMTEQIHVLKVQMIILFVNSAY
ncbi:hypothetical protein CEXT_580631 [Caerostris extrusa]|uniref:Uncharacterized protein n=1 Tax=Caerostris extrusa TaxID=172846 RepID=A0AAV4QAP4_CAEEX|nr:hypothetical protein CEXT_580631 [Caerostris extrusa]